MSRKRIILFALAAMSCCSLSAQRRPFDALPDANPWLAGTNYAGVRADTSSNISYAEIYAGAEAGEFRRSCEASSLWRAGAEARTIKHVERFSMAGGFSFSQMTGRDMCGSMSIRPGYYPIDVLEFTPGRKTLQTYAFDGGVGVDLAPRLRVGAGMDFTSANYSKRKDLRHTNYLLDMTVSAGVTYALGDVLLGANYLFRKDSESIDAEQIGTGESSYCAFLDKGLYYGKYEVWTGSGVHLDEAGVQGLPIKETLHGAGVQLSRGGSHIEAEYLFGGGSAGEKQTVWYRFPTREVNVRLSQALSPAGKNVYLRASWSHRTQSNFETVLDKVTEGGVTLTQEYGSNLIFQRATDAAALEMKVVRPTFEYVASAGFDALRAVSSQMYPYIAEERVRSLSLGFSPTFHTKGFDFGLDAFAAFGSLSDSERVVTEDSGVVDSPYRLQEYYDLWAAYETAPRVGISPFARLHFGKGLYIQAEGSFVRSFSEALPGYRERACLRLGLDF